MAKTEGRKSLIRLKIPSNYAISGEVLERARKEIQADAKETLRILSAVSHPIRLRILRALKVDELCVCVFVVMMKCKYSKLSYHLKLLKKAGLIESTKEKNFLIYRITDFGRQILKSVESKTR